MAERAQQVATAVGEAMAARDNAARMLGIALKEIRPGFARMEMAVRPDMLNGHETCHGGIIFTLADTAFAHACNSGNQVTVAQHCTISFVAPVRKGDILTATAEERHRAGRTGFTDINVTNQAGKLVAVFRGHSYQLNGEVVPNTGTIDS